MTDYAAVYRESRERVTALTRDASAEELARTVPGCPEWTVVDTVAHLVGVADDVLGGRLQHVPSPEETAGQVTQRRDRQLDDVLAEWDRVGPQLEAAVAARRVPLNLVHDIVTHEADLRGALGAGRPPEPAWAASLQHLSRRFDGWLGRSGTLTVDAGEHRFTAGSGEPSASVTVDDAYEFWRALFGRRSREQMASWRWDGDPAPHLAAIPLFGPTTQDLAEPR